MQHLFTGLHHIGINKHMPNMST